MKLYELFEGRERQERLDKQTLTRDYQRWKRLINMPTKIVRAMAGEDDITDRGMTARELQKKYGFTMPRSAAKAIIRLRSLPLNQWTTPDINWMYRMLNYVNTKKDQRIVLVKDNDATEQLKDLWAWGHIPRGLKPTNKKFKDDIFESTSSRDPSKVAEDYKRWKQLINMPTITLRRFLDSQIGKEAGLSREEAKKAGGIKTGRDSARAILRMREKNFKEWSPEDINWMYRQISFVSRMSKMSGPLYQIKDGKKIPTRKLTSLWIWGHIPSGHSPHNFEIFRN